MIVHEGWTGDLGDFSSLGLRSDASTPQSPAVQALRSKLKPEVRKMSALDQLEAEMRLLQWHKLANDQALKAALIKTKKLRSKDRELMSTKRSTSNDMELEEKVAWMQQIIDEEQSKPLQVSRDFVLQYERVETERKEKLENEIFRHVENLKRIRKRMDKELDLRRRHQTFQRWKVERAPIKKAIMEGKVVTATSLASSHASDSNSLYQSSMYTQQTGLETVLQSLSKLEQLEQRIATLERNKAAKQVAVDAGNAGTVKAEVKFAKRRVDPLAGKPARAVYTVRLHQGMTNRVGSTVRRQPVRQPVPKAGAHISAEKFLRSLPNLNAKAKDDTKREAIRAHERRMQMTLTAGQSTLRSRVKARQQRQQEQQAQQQRHRAAVKAMDANKSKPHVIRPKANVQVAKGAASGRRFANQAMQEFEDIRRMHQRRRAALDRQSSQASLARSKPVHTGHPRQARHMLSQSAGIQRGARQHTSFSRSLNNSTATSKDAYPVVGAGVGGIRALRRR